MKLDLNSAWDSAMKLIGGNREVILVLAGVFFFLPYVVFSLLVPTDALTAAGTAETMDRAAMEGALIAFTAQYWWAIVLLALVQTVGATAVMAIIGDPARPTVGDAMKRGAVLLISQLAAQMLMSVGMVILFMIALMIGALGGSHGLIMVLAVLSIPVIIYLAARLSLAGATIAIARMANPVAALGASWRLTKANGLRLAAFYTLLIVAFLVIGQVIGLLISLLTALPGADFAAILDALLSGLLNAAFAVMIYAVFAAVHRQLAQAARVGTQTDDL